MRKLLKVVNRRIPPVLTWLIRRLLPPAYWYGAVFQISRLLAPAMCELRRSAWNGRLSQAVFINRMMALLTRSRRAFPVPWKADGLDLLRGSLACPAGVVLCSAHLPLVKVACRAMMESGIAVAGAITDNPSVTDSLAVWGLTDRMPALQVGPYVLVRVRSLLLAGKVVLLLLDPSLGGAFSPNILRLAKRLNSTVLLFSVELQEDGANLVRLFAPVGSEVEGQLGELQREADRIRHRRSL